MTPVTVIALDAMGGDFAPRVPVAAAVQAVERPGCEVILVGDRPALEEELARRTHRADRIRIRHTSAQIAMDEAPTAAVRRKPDASLPLAFELVRAGEAQAVVGAGHSGAMMVAGKLVLGTLAGIDRPAIAAPLPRKRGATVLLDVGANADCRPRHLVQFAHMGRVYARTALNVSEPRVGLLSNGGEAGKGNELVREAFPLLQAEVPGFVGNVEPRDLFRGRADVVVCDGFSGNLVVKTAEAAALQATALLRERMTRRPLARVGYWLLRGFFVELAGRTDYRTVGGSPLLGLRGVAIVSHGGSSPRSLTNAIATAVQCVEHNLVARLERQLGREPAPGAAAEA